MNAYLAARYTRREELCAYRSELEAMGWTVTSRWLNGDHQVSNADLLGENGDGSQYAVELRQRFAREDLEDLRAADLVIAFTEEPRATNSRGGRHVELGIALGIGIPVLIVGPRENVFCCLVPEVEVSPTWEHAREVLNVASPLIAANCSADAGEADA